MDIVPSLIELLLDVKILTIGEGQLVNPEEELVVFCTFRRAISLPQDVLAFIKKVLFPGANVTVAVTLFVNES